MKTIVFGVLLCLSSVMGGWAQKVQTTTKTFDFNNNKGLAINLHNSGFGINGFWTKSISKDLAFTAEASLRSEKDEKEEKYFDWWGNSIIPYKLNYLLLLPVQAGIQKRLFSEVIDDSFRPYVQVTAGPTLAWVSPYFDDQNQNQQLDDVERIYDSIASIPHGKPVLGIGGGLALGAQFGKSRRALQAVRIGMDIQFYPTSIQLMERTIREPQQVFLTPSFAIIFGKYR
ncbi:MAG TPA: hypothetical protein PLO56_10120 [Rhodothermales bacterium]|nr:hypothetical protein [Rhodothermales bacterium]